MTTKTAKPAKKNANKMEQVDEFMQKLDHPLKAEVQQVREIIKGVNKGITEEIKWNAPSFSYKGYMVTFNLRARQHVHLIFHNPEVVHLKSAILEGDYPTRRMTYFADMKDVQTKKAELIRVVKQLVKVMDQQ